MLPGERRVSQVVNKAMKKGTCCRGRPGIVSAPYVVAGQHWAHLLPLLSFSVLH